MKRGQDNVILRISQTIDNNLSKFRCHFTHCKAFLNVITRTSAQHLSTAADALFACR